ncbi:hypothetical protein [Citreimonas salinaria]|uniref:Uncharacterized protein n=1 Tax=Citreimonas salinaria TaxID=321339 RepID=A0A1H3KE57_9RHOB|nr:hypothetical protein [Citreimonas salinaria]SDY50512.1 hypothetical protein SAMN05444340_10988 [Citreimonas salinaria]
MKRIIASALVAAAALGTATAAVAAPTQGQLNDIARYAPEADLSTLSEREVNVLLTVIHGGDSESEKRNAVRGYLD